MARVCLREMYQWDETYCVIKLVCIPLATYSVQTQAQSGQYANNISLTQFSIVPNGQKLILRKTNVKFYDVTFCTQSLLYDDSCANNA